MGATAGRDGLTTLRPGGHGWPRLEGRGAEGAGGLCGQSQVESRLARVRAPIVFYLRRAQGQE